MNRRDKKSGPTFDLRSATDDADFAGLHFVLSQGRLPTKTNLEVST
jgi:hypothetical protein